ncbi:hypothetical protein JXR93_09450 [bacterium]|nr:hypothetical protein [bacterium]
MDIPSVDSPIWRKLVTGEKSVDFSFLAIKVFLGRAKLMIGSDSSEENIKKVSLELRDLFLKYSSIPTIQKDIELLN